MKYAWLTDIHLNFLSKSQRSEFYKTIKDVNGILISGDIAEAKTLEFMIREMYYETRLPIGFILGNHDYYGSNVETVRKTARDLIHDFEYLDNNVLYLTQSEVWWQPVEGTYICGVDGWADTRAGNWKDSDVRLNDSIHIKDLRL